MSNLLANRKGFRGFGEMFQDTVITPLSEATIAEVIKKRI